MLTEAVTRAVSTLPGKVWFTFDTVEDVLTDFGEVRLTFGA